MEEMANYNKPQRRGNSLPCNVPDIFRHRRCHGAFHPDTTRGAERHEQQYCNPVTVHPTRDHSRPADDSLVPFALRFCLRQLLHPTPNWSTGPCISETELDELLVLLLQRNSNGTQFPDRGTKYWLDALCAFNGQGMRRNSLHGVGGIGPWCNRIRFDGRIEYVEFGQL